MLVEQSVKGACKVVVKREGMSIADEILDCAETGDRSTDFGGVHIIVLGSNGQSEALPPASAEKYNEYVANKRASQKQGSVALEVLTKARTASVMIITVDALLSGHVEALSFSEWFGTGA